MNEDLRAATRNEDYDRRFAELMARCEADPGVADHFRRHPVELLVAVGISRAAIHSVSDEICFALLRKHIAGARASIGGARG